MDLNAIFAQRQQAPGLYEKFMQGREARQRRTINSQVIAQNEQKLETQEQKAFGEQDLAYVNAIGNTARIVKTAPQEAWGPILNKRRQQFVEAGFPTEGIDAAIQMYRSGDMEGLNKLIEDYEDLEVPGKRRVQSSTFTQLKDESGKTVPAQAVTYSDGTSEVVALEAPEGFSIPQAETAQEKRLAQFKDFVRRQQNETEQAAIRAFNNSIAQGEATDMAEAKRQVIPASMNLRKAQQLKSLLSEFSTGGFTQAFQNTVQSFFGVRPANEEEAENLMRAQALSLLANFKGQISDAEREFVLQQAPNFGLSKEGNLRIVDNFIEDAEIQIAAGNAAMRGRDAYDTYLKGLVRQGMPKVTEADVMKEFSEDDIARVMRARGLTREEVIGQAIKDMQAERAQSGG